MRRAGGGGPRTILILNEMGGHCRLCAAINLRVTGDLEGRDWLSVSVPNQLSGDHHMHPVEAGRSAAGRSWQNTRA